MNDLRFPIGRFAPIEPVTLKLRTELIDRIARHPATLSAIVEGLSEVQIDTPYRKDGWTVRQVVHHLPESHLNGFTRFKLTLTEERPTIRTYYEDRWASMADSRAAPIEDSLQLLDALHRRWVFLLRSLDASDWKRQLAHPEVGIVDLDFLLQLYAWHGDHHIAHISRLCLQEGWGATS